MTKLDKLFYTITGVIVLGLFCVQQRVPIHTDTDMIVVCQGTDIYVSMYRLHHGCFFELANKPTCLGCDGVPQPSG